MSGKLSQKLSNISPQEVSPWVRSISCLLNFQNIMFLWAGVCPSGHWVRVRTLPFHHRTHARAIFLFSGRKQERHHPGMGRTCKRLKVRQKFWVWEAAPASHTFASLQNRNWMRWLSTSKVMFGEIQPIFDDCHERPFSILTDILVTERRRYLLGIRCIIDEKSWYCQYPVRSHLQRWWESGLEPV